MKTIPVLLVSIVFFLVTCATSFAGPRGMLKSTGGANFSSGGVGFKFSGGNFGFRGGFGGKGFRGKRGFRGNRGFRNGFNRGFNNFGFNNFGFNNQFNNGFNIGFQQGFNAGANSGFNSGIGFNNNFRNGNRIGAAGYSNRRFGNFYKPPERIRSFKKAGAIVSSSANLVPSNANVTAPRKRSRFGGVVLLHPTHKDTKGLQVIHPHRGTLRQR